MQPQSLIRTCSIWRALEIVGDTPTLLILEAGWLGARRFDDFWRETRLLKALLSDRLKRLVEANVLEKQLYSQSPPRFFYRLTEKGRDLYPVALMLLQWEKDWGEEAARRTITLTHKPCGHEFTPTPACKHCAATIDATRVDWREGPGVGWMAPHYSRRRQLRDSIGEGSLLFHQAAQLMGDRWASLIMRSIFTGIRTFDEIRADTAIATNILSERLSWLITIGVIRQHQYAAGPVRHEYRLTRKGVGYYPALLLLLQWGDTYYVSPEGPPLLLTHRDCGAALEPIVTCSHCHTQVQARDVDFTITDREAPGALGVAV
nr:helix-turn-helix domain-containing protein [Polymorphobacter sp.]